MSPLHQQEMHKILVIYNLVQGIGGLSSQIQQEELFAGGD